MKIKREDALLLCNKERNQDGEKKQVQIAQITKKMDNLTGNGQ